MLPPVAGGRTEPFRTMLGLDAAFGDAAPTGFPLLELIDEVSDFIDALFSNGSINPFELLLSNPLGAARGDDDDAVSIVKEGLLLVIDPLLGRAVGEEAPVLIIRGAIREEERIEERNEE